MSSTIRRSAALKAFMGLIQGSRTPGAPSVGDRLSAVPRMLSAGLSGRYPFLDRGRLALSVVALLYMLSPVDLVPEALLGLLGMGDDALVAAWLTGAVLSETDTFLAWEKAQANGESDIRVVPGEIIEDDQPRRSR